MKTKLLILMILASILPVGYAYAWEGGDNTDKLSNSQSSVFSPGYINAAKQQAYEIINQNNKPKSWWDNLVDKVKNNTSDSIEEDANTKIEPDVKKKVSSSNGTIQNPTSVALTQNPGSVASSNYNVPIGSGTNQEYVNSKLVSEVFNGVRHVYAGFSQAGYGTIGEAITASNKGDIIIIKGGSYSRIFTLTTTRAANGRPLGYFSTKSDIILYGGYDDNGIRDTVNYQTIISNLVTFSGLNNVTFNGLTFATGVFASRS